MSEGDATVNNETERGDLACQNCGSPLSTQDLRCGLGQFCVDCCKEPAFAHGVNRGLMARVL